MASSPSDPRRDLTADPDDPEAAARHRAALRRSDPEAHFAVIACVHGNLPALEAVFADIDRREIPRVVCLGDMIGYGPNPVECVDLVFERCDWSLMGHCDHFLTVPPGQNLYALRLTETLPWCRSLLEPNETSSDQKRETWRELLALPEKRSMQGWDFVHGSPTNPVFGSLSPNDVFHQPGMTGDCLDLVVAPLFCARTHTPFAITRTSRARDRLSIVTRIVTKEDYRPPFRHSPSSISGRIIEDFHNETLSIDRDDQTIVNVGSVGLPEDRDPRACYVEVCEDLVTWRRVEYDVEETIRRMTAVPQIDRRLAESLRVGF